MRIERIGQAAPSRRCWHELGNALSAGPAHCGGVKAALLPDQPDQESRRQIMCSRGRSDFRADRADEPGRLLGRRGALHSSLFRRSRLFSRFRPHCGRESGFKRRAPDEWLRFRGGFGADGKARAQENESRHQIRHVLTPSLKGGHAHTLPYASTKTSIPGTPDESCSRFIPGRPSGPGGCPAAQNARGRGVLQRLIPGRGRRGANDNIPMLNRAVPPRFDRPVERLLDRTLTAPVPLDDRRRPIRSIRLRNVDPAHRRGDIAARLDALQQVQKIGLKVRFVVGRCPSGRCRAHHPCGSTGRLPSSIPDR